ncbi:MAG: hypothetical protein LUG24_03465, partial [Clostridiales bacterium]|nr:hypothetical protein [Clostridiales bacterium]
NRSGTLRKTNFHFHPLEVEINFSLQGIKKFKKIKKGLDFFEDGSTIDFKHTDCGMFFKGY